MGHNVIVQLPEEFYEILKRRAELLGTAPADVAATMLVQQLRESAPNAVPLTEAEAEEADLRFQRHFGAAKGVVGSMDNETIDADLAREYGDTHEAG